MTDTEKAALCARIDELCAEVERRKSEFKKMDVWHSQELKAAMDENAKLRELVDGLRYCADEPHCVCAVRTIGSDEYMSCCPLYDTSSGTARCESLMRELGIEVPDGEA